MNVAHLDKMPAVERAFVEQWRHRAVRIGFPMLSPVPDPATGRLVDFAEIGDEEELAATSARVEEAYLEFLRADRDAFLARWQHEGERRHYANAWLRDLLKTDAYYLGKYYLGFEDFTMHYHFAMCRQAGTVQDGDSCLFEHMRGAFKSTIHGILFCVQRLLRDPNATILYLSQTVDNASNKLEEIKNKFYVEPHRENKLVEVFPEFGVRKVQEKGSGIHWVCPARTNQQGEASITAAGITKAKEGYHVDIIVCDDIWGENSVSDLEQMSKIRNRFQNVRFLFKRTGAKVLVTIGTRFSMDDLTRDIQDKGTFKVTIVSGLLANGRSIFPEGLTVAEMMEMVAGKEGAEVSGIWSFSCQIILNPTAADAGFLREWFAYETWGSAKARVASGELSVRIVILLDAAADDKTSSDDVAIGVVALRSDKKAHLVECLAEKMGPSAFVKTVEGLWDKWQPEFIVRQKTVLETTLMSFFIESNKRRIAEGRAPLRFRSYSLHKREKKARITAALQPRLQRGQILFDPELPTLRKIEQSLLDHPNTSRDDIPDMLSELDDQRVWRFPEHVARPRQVEARPPSTHGEVQRADLVQKQANARLAFEMARRGRSTGGYPGEVAA
jgi:hypothetical protein